MKFQREPPPPKRNRRLALLLTLLCPLMLAWAGCRSASEDDRVLPTGFLADYSMLVEGDEGMMRMRYIDPETDLAAYRGILIEPVTIWRDKTSDWSGIDYAELDEIADYTLFAFHRRLKHDYRLVATPGEGVMALRIALTEKSEVPVVLETASGTIPKIFGEDRTRTLSPGSAELLGKATLEAELVDTVTGRRIAAGVDDRVGRSRFPEAGGRWIEVDTALDHWAARLQAVLRDAREGRK